MSDLPPTTPPVTDTGLTSSTSGDWDGTERRRVDPLALAIKSAVGRIENGPPTSLGQTNIVTTIVAISAILALQCLILVSQFRLADRLNDSNDEQRRFREAVVCFLVETTRTQEENISAGRAPNGFGSKVLTTCGFITTPGGD